MISHTLGIYPGVIWLGLEVYCYPIFWEITILRQKRKSHGHTVGKGRLQEDLQPQKKECGGWGVRKEWSFYLRSGTLEGKTWSTNTWSLGVWFPALGGIRFCCCKPRICMLAGFRSLDTDSEAVVQCWMLQKVKMYLKKKQEEKQKKGFWWALSCVNLPAIYKILHMLFLPPVMSSVWCTPNTTYIPCFWRRHSKSSSLWLPNIPCPSSQILYSLS